MIIKDRYNSNSKYNYDTFKYNPAKPATFLFLLEELDFPYIEQIWLSIYKHNYDTGTPEKTLGKYIGTMRLLAYKELKWEDSEYTKGVEAYLFELGDEKGLFFIWEPPVSEFKQVGKDRVKIEKIVEE